MPSRPDLRELASNVKEAFAELDRETLLEILTFVIKEYVVEGPPPMLVHQAETLADLRGATFAQIISALQTRFDHPELQMFVVDGETVSVRVGGTLHPLVTRPGTTIVEMPTRPAPPPAAAPAPAAAPQAQPGQAPPPARGLSVRSAPGPGQPAAQQPAAAPAPAPGAAPAAQSGVPEAKPDKPEGSGDDASAR